MSLKTVLLPSRYNYVACFLTLDCNLNCNYCINSAFGSSRQAEKVIIPGEKWTALLNRLVCPEDVPVTIQGGEPSLHPDFMRIIKNIKADLHIDILTNLCFDIDVFIEQINPERLRRQAPYPSIRVSYHPYYMDLDDLVQKVLKMQHAGFSIGIFSILHPHLRNEVQEAQEKCTALGIDFRTKEFLGEYYGQLYGTYLYPGAVGNNAPRKCQCRTSELIIGPEANVYRCHHDLYNDFPPVGNMLDSDVVIEDGFRECNNFGCCNPCDVKIKTNRFQVYGHTSVEILDIR